MWTCTFQQNCHFPSLSSCLTDLVYLLSLVAVIAVMLSSPAQTQQVSTRKQASILFIYCPYETESVLSVRGIFLSQNVLKFKDDLLADLKANWAYPSMPPSVQSQAVWGWQALWLPPLEAQRTSLYLPLSPLPPSASTFTFPLSLSLHPFHLLLSPLHFFPCNSALNVPSSIFSLFPFCLCSSVTLHLIPFR